MKGKDSLFFFTQVVTKQFPAVLIIVAVNTEIFPVRAIRGIVTGISVFMMYCHKMPVLVIKLPRTFSTDEPVNLERSFSVVTGSGGGLSQFPYDIIHRFFPVPLYRCWLSVDTEASVTHFHVPLLAW